MPRGDNRVTGMSGGETGATNETAEVNPIPEGNPGGETQVQDEARSRDQHAAEEPKMEAAARASDMLSTPGAEKPSMQPQPGVHPSMRTDFASPMPEGDTAAQNAGNATPGVADPFPALTRTQFANQRVMGIIPDNQPSPWPIAPAPVDAGLVSPTGLAMRPAKHEAALSHLSMRLGELRNFLAGFDHELILAGETELHKLVSYLKHTLGLPQNPDEVAAAKAGYHAAVTGPGTGGVAGTAGAGVGAGPASTTTAGSYAQGGFGPAAVQENTK